MRVSVLVSYNLEWYHDVLLVYSQCTRSVFVIKAFFITYKKKLHLLQSDLYSIQAYRAKPFILPKKVIKVNEKKINSFLWNGNDKSAFWG